MKNTTTLIIAVLLTTGSKAFAKGDQFVEISEDPIGIEGVLQQTNSLTSLRAEIKKMIKLLEVNTLDASGKMVRRYSLPEDLEEMIEDEEFEEFLKEFHEEYRIEAIKLLKATATIKPELNEEGTEYNFTFPDNIGEIHETSFEWREDTKKFYISN